MSIEDIKTSQSDGEKWAEAREKLMMQVMKKLEDAAYNSGELAKMFKASKSVLGMDLFAESIYNKNLKRKTIDGEWYYWIEKEEVVLSTNSAVFSGCRISSA